jgi:hypothetical protein
MANTQPSLQSIFRETLRSITLHHGSLEFLSPGQIHKILTLFRAGANFSAISASDPNALRWDKLGYTYLLDLAAKDGKNAFVKETPSVEYWDELPSREKIDSMASYLKDVSYR